MRKLILLVGPTCTGKSTVEKEFNARGIASVVSYTTRRPRTGEVHGRDYYFLTMDEVNDLEATGGVAQKVTFAGNYYGSTLDSHIKAFGDDGQYAVMVVEPTGVTQLRAYFAARPELGIEVYAVYIKGEYKTLVERLINRFHADKAADDGYYWRRVVEQASAYRNWPHYTAYDLVIDEVDDRDGMSVSAATGYILGTINR
jgi:guanylate kinase